MDRLQYLGFQGSIEFVSETRTFFGRLLAIRHNVSYAAPDLESLAANFHAAIEEYILFRDEIAAHHQADHVEDGKLWIHIEA